MPACIRECMLSCLSARGRECFCGVRVALHAVIDVQICTGVGLRLFVWFLWYMDPRVCVGVLLCSLGH